MTGSYASPQAFRMALEARLRASALEQGLDLQRLQRLVAFERFLARLFAGDNPPWVLKGGYALELRLAGQARSTLDLDISVLPVNKMVTLHRQDLQSSDSLYHALTDQATLDLGDSFTYVIKPPTTIPSQSQRGSIRFSVTARLAGHEFCRFRLDVGTGDPLLQPPDWIACPDSLGFAGIAPPRVAVCPVAQQFAEKLHAYTFPWVDREGTRVKDLVDMILLVASALLQAEAVQEALVATFRSRSTHPIPNLIPEAPGDWSDPFEALAEEMGLSTATTLDAVLLLRSVWADWQIALEG